MGAEVIISELIASVPFSPLYTKRQYKAAGSLTECQKVNMALFSRVLNPAR